MGGLSSHHHLGEESDEELEGEAPVLSRPEDVDDDHHFDRDFELFQGGRLRPPDDDDYRLFASSSEEGEDKDI
eukprot:9143032-Pyramimonas_sp.AAC.1